MATDLNRCEFIGRLGREVELKPMKNGENMATFSIAVNETYTGKNGEKVKNTEWVNVIVYRKLAEICSKYLTKGSHVYVAGRLSTHKYIGKDGLEKMSVQITLNDMQMLGQKFHQEDKSEKDEAATLADDFYNDDIPF